MTRPGSGLGTGSWPAVGRRRRAFRRWRRKCRTGDVDSGGVAPGRIRDDDIAAVRERAQIDAIIGEYVSLRNAGGGSLKGLCPFPDEKTPSLHVTPSRGYVHCFGWGVGGDAISSLQNHDPATMAEAIP